MSTGFLISKEIGIDYGHRVPDHGSKCKNLHGHRARIEAIVTGNLASQGEQTGMVMDFGFVKQLMVNVIERTCDHGLIVYVDDPMLRDFISLHSPKSSLEGVMDDIKSVVAKDNYWEGGFFYGKVYVIDSVPTIENLCKHWYNLLAPLISARSEGAATLHQIKAWETPSGYAVYPSHIKDI